MKGEEEVVPVEDVVTREEIVTGTVEVVLEAEVLVVDNEEVAEDVKAEPPVTTSRKKDKEPEAEELAIPEKVVPSVEEVVHRS